MAERVDERRAEETASGKSRDPVVSKRKHVTLQVRRPHRNVDVRRPVDPVPDDRPFGFSASAVRCRLGGNRGSDQQPRKARQFHRDQTRSMRGTAHRTVYRQSRCFAAHPPSRYGFSNGVFLPVCLVQEPLRLESSTCPNFVSRALRSRSMASAPGRTRSEAPDCLCSRSDERPGTNERCAFVCSIQSMS